MLGCEFTCGLLVREHKVLIGHYRATSMLIGYSINDIINTIKRLHYAHNSQSRLRPGPDHNSGFSIEILRALSIGHSFGFGFHSCFSLQVIWALSLHHQLLVINVYTTGIVSQLWAYCNAVTINFNVQPFMAFLSLIDTFQIHNHGQPMQQLMPNVRHVRKTLFKLMLTLRYNLCWATVCHLVDFSDQQGASLHQPAMSTSFLTEISIWATWPY